MISRSFIVYILVICLTVTCLSCSNTINSQKEQLQKHYIIKKARQPVSLNTNWTEKEWQHANTLELKNFMGDKPEHFPETQVKLLYDEKNLYVFFRVEDRYIKACTTETHGKVWHDSCVEFFFAPDARQPYQYFNLETNCAGVFLFRFNNTNNKTEAYVEPLDCGRLEIAHSLPKFIPEEITDPTVWYLSYKLPFEILSKYSQATPPESGSIWKANFYKCADKSSHPHWLTWSHVNYPKPNFHQPEYFGNIVFE